MTGVIIRFADEIWFAEFVAATYWLYQKLLADVMSSCPTTLGRAAVELLDGPQAILTTPLCNFCRLAGGGSAVLEEVYSGCVSHERLSVEQDEGTTKSENCV